MVEEVGGDVDGKIVLIPLQGARTCPSSALDQHSKRKRTKDIMFKRALGTL
jgi:hypothetical protein